MEKYLFDDWHQFKTCFLAGCEKFIWGFCRIITATILGLLSLIRYLWRLLIESVTKYPKSTIIVGLMAILLVYGYTYTRMKAKLVAAEFNRDSISYRLSKYEAMYETDTDSVIVIKHNSKNDTIPVNYDRRK